MDKSILVMLRDEIGIPVQTIANEMGVGRQTVYRMLEGQAWTPTNTEKLNSYLERLRSFLKKI